jgi:hypothetical protein
MINKNTHFQGFAKLLWDELCSHGFTSENYDPDQSMYRDFAVELIAQRACDLMVHIIDHAPPSVSDADDWDIPDLTEWPE